MIACEFALQVPTSSIVMPRRPLLDSCYPKTCARRLHQAMSSLQQASKRSPSCGHHTRPMLQCLHLACWHTCCCSKLAATSACHSWEIKGEAAASSKKSHMRHTEQVLQQTAAPGRQQSMASSTVLQAFCRRHGCRSLFPSICSSSCREVSRQLRGACSQASN